jgi:hypothetical protein
MACIRARRSAGVMGFFPVMAGSIARRCTAAKGGAFVPRYRGREPDKHGLNYTFAELSRADFSLRTEESPPASRFTPSQAQSKTSVDFTSGYRLSDRFALSTLFGETDGHTVAGMQSTQRWFPMSALGIGFMMDPHTQISTDFGSRTIMRRASVQSFGDISAARRLSQNMALNLGLGTTFNPMAGAKAHYLAFGVDCR